MNTEKILIKGEDVDLAVERGLKKALREMHSPEHTMEAIRYIRAQPKCNDEVVPAGVLMFYQLTSSSAADLSDQHLLPGQLVYMIMGFYVRKELEELHPAVQRLFKEFDAFVESKQSA